MNPSPAQVASIKGFVAGLAGGWGNTDAQIRAAMAATTVANPTPQATVGKPYTASTVLGSGQISAASVGKLLTLPSFDASVIPLLNLPAKAAADTASLAAWAGAYLEGGTITQAEHDYLAAPTTGVFNLTEPDPSWTASVPWDVGTLGRPVDDFDLETARHS